MPTRMRLGRAILLVACFGGAVGPSGCLGPSGDPEAGGGGHGDVPQARVSPAAARLRRRFPERAPAVLATPAAFAETADGFAVAGGRAGLELRLPRRGEDVLQFALADGFTARVRELGAGGRAEK